MPHMVTSAAGSGASRPSGSAACTPGIAVAPRPLTRPELKRGCSFLDRLDPVLPLSSGRIERHGFEYYRHGTLSLYAGFNTQTGEVFGKTAARHTSVELVVFLGDIIAHQPRRKRIHVICDNFSAHKIKGVDGSLTPHPNVHLHYTPTCSFRLSQSGLWFCKIERDVIARGVFTSVKDLKKKLRQPFAGRETAAR